jgi:hypothetical protein
LTAPSFFRRRRKAYKIFDFCSALRLLRTFSNALPCMHLCACTLRTLRTKGASASACAQNPLVALPKARHLKCKKRKARQPKGFEVQEAHQKANPFFYKVKKCQVSSKTKGCQKKLRFF